MHAAYSRGEVRAHNVEFDIDWELAPLAGGAPIVGTRDLYRTYDRQQGSGADSLVEGGLTATTQQRALLGWGFKLQQGG